MNSRGMKMTTQNTKKQASSTFSSGNIFSEKNHRFSASRADGAFSKSSSNCEWEYLAGLVDNIAFVNFE